MKKFLSLVLALVMTMSLVTVSAGAKDFTDSDSITYDEAVAVISEIGIVDGYTDGDFKPTSTLTRGAAAKIICNLVLGPTTASALVADAAPYSDVPTTNTFAGYIAYCQKEGIISGYADGTFRPGNSLTGYAFMKMLLGALGYDSDVEGYTGNNWSIQVAKRAISIGLDDGLSSNFDGTKAVNREEACLYAFNALQATMVQYDSKTTVTVGGATVNVGGSEAEDVANNTSSDGNIKDDKLMQFAEKYFTNLKKSKTSNDDLGRPAVEWKYKSSTIGTYANSADLEATYTSSVDKGDLYTLLGKTLVEDIEDGDATLETYVDGVDGKFDIADLAVKSSTADAGASGNGVLTEVYVNDEYGKDEDETLVTVVFINTYLAQASSDYNSSKETLAITFVNDNGSAQPSGFPTSISQDDFDVSDFEEDDYLLVTWSKDSREIQSVKAASILTGEVDTYQEEKNVTIDGTKYSYNKIVGSDGKENEFSVGEEASLVLDEYGYILYVDDAVASSNYVYIQEFATTNGLNKKAEAAAYFTDGSYDEITVKKLVVNNTSEDKELTKASDIASDTYENSWYTYSVNSSDEYTLKYVGSASKKYTSATEEYTKDVDDVVSNGSVKFLKDANDNTVDIKANSSTVFLVLDEDEDVSVYTGISNVPDIDVDELESGGNAYVSYVKKADTGYATYVFIDLSNASSSGIDEVGGSSTDYMFVLDSLGKLIKVSSDDNYREVDVIRDGAVTTIKVADGSDAEDKLEEGVLYNKVRTDSNDYVTNATEIGSKADQIAEAELSDPIEYNDGTLTLGGVEYILNDGYEINLIVDNAASDLLDDDDADYETYLNITGRALEGYLEGYDYEYSFYAILDDDDSDTIDVLYVWISSAESTDAADTYKVSYEYDEDLVTVTGDESVKDGENLTFTIAPKAGVTVTAVIIDGEEQTVTSSGKYTVRKVKDDVTVEIEAEASYVDVFVTFVDNGGNERGTAEGKVISDGKSYITVKAADYADSIENGYELKNKDATAHKAISDGFVEVNFTVKETESGT